MTGLTFQKQQRESRALFPFGQEEIANWLAGGARLAGSLLLKSAGNISNVQSSCVVLDFQAGAYCPLSVFRALQPDGLCGFELADRKPALRWLKEKGRAEHCLIGLTGVIGSGKSTLSSLLSARGAVILDADLFARQALVKGSRGFVRVHHRFGDAVLTAEGDLDRQALARLMFSVPQVKLEVEAIVHPLIREQYI